MKQFTFILIVFISFNSYAGLHKNDLGIEISLPDKWQSTFMGSLLFDTDFVLVNAETRDMLAIKLYPKNLLFNSDSMPSNTKGIVQTMQTFASIYAHDIFLKENETILDSSFIKQNNMNGIIFSSQYQNSGDHNVSWVGNTQKHMVLLKITTKSDIKTYQNSEIIALLNSSNITKTKKDGFNDTPYSLSLGFEFKQYPEISKLKDHTKNDLYKNMNTVYVEEDITSAYTISSICSGIKIPDSLLSSIILKDFGIENSLFNGHILHNETTYPLVIGQYTTDKDDEYHMISTIVENNNCQHLLAYIVEKEKPLVDRFIKFIDHFETMPIHSKEFIKNIPSHYKSNYANTLIDLAYQFYQLKMYEQSNLLYRQSYEIMPSEDTVSSILNTYNTAYHYQKGLDFIDTLSTNDVTQNTNIWKAWFYSKLNQPKFAATTYKEIFDKTYSTDEDFFKYLDQLSQLEQYSDMHLLIEKYKNNVEDQQRLKITSAKIQTKTQPNKAKSYILSLLTDENLIVNHQYKLLDELIELEAYEEIVKYCDDRIAKGYESAILLNYLGDAHNFLGKTTLAYEIMLKAHKMAPKNSNIESYYKSLRNKIGKADLSVLENEIQTVPIPLEMQEKISLLKAKNLHDSYEHLYSVIAYSHTKNGKNRKTIYNKRKINNYSGIANNKTLHFSFDKEYENIYINKFNVLDKDNNLITKFDVSKAYITTDDDGIVADTDKLLNIPVPSLEVGFMIDYAITIESKSPSVNQPFTESYFVSSVSNQYEAVILSGDITNIAVDVSSDINIHNVSETLKYWDYVDTPNYKKTPLLPDLQEIFPIMKFSTVKDSWTQTGDEYLEMIKDKLNTKIDNNLLLSLTAENNNDIENAKTIILYVQENISYQAIEFGMRAQIPNTSTTTIENMYGDCKDHAVLLHDLLNSANIKAELALVNSGNDISINLPTHNQFNHMIVYLPEINGGVFIDTTDKDSSLDFLNPPSGMQGYNALVLKNKNSKLVKIPISQPENNTINIQRTVDKNEKNYVYHETAIITGSFASSFRNYLKGIEIDELESSILKWVNSYYSDLVLTDFKYHNLYDNNQPLKLEFSFLQDSEYASVKLPVFIERYALEFTPSPKRNWDFELKDSFEIKSKTQILEHRHLKLATLNKEINSNLMKWKISSDKQSIEFNGTIYPNKLPASEYANLIKQGKSSYKTIEKLLIDTSE